MPKEISPELAAADAAAEQLLKTGSSTTLTGVDPARESALDEAFASVVPQAEETPELGRENNGVKPPIDGAPAEKPVTPAPAPEKPEVKPAPKADAPPKPTEKPGRKGLLDDVIEEPAAPAADTPEKAYDEIKLRSDASPKTQESFQAQRALAIQRETAVRTELQAAKDRALELEAKLTESEKRAGALPDDVAAEIKSLREFRALHDVSSRPEFREKFDSRIEANFESIYTLFKQEGFTDEKLTALKNLPEADRVAFIEGKIIPLLTDGQKRVVSAKIFDNVNISEEKSKALATARTDADKILAAQKEAPAQERAAKDKAFADVLRPRLQKLPYVYVKEIPSTATAAEKAEIEAHNAFAIELQDSIRRAIDTTDLEDRADAVLAVPIARHLSRQVKILSARTEAAEAKLAAIVKAGQTGRLSKQVPTPEAPQTKRGVDTSADDSVDALFSEVTGGQRP